MVDMDEVKLVTWSSARWQFLATEALNAQMDVHGVATISPRLAAFWFISFREQRKTSGDEHLRNFDAKGDQTVFNSQAVAARSDK